ncbi:terminase [Latilactobacillus curvatus]|uniref:Terminase n=1 Tax=Latilactobacillus curvatus TaxID=28038 RepID=A0AAC9Y0R2_LATCU|nr:terminase small subunit [Latilactobacillus curvatus]ASN59821.1 terminase [Latilactobacillus curvatus]
MQDEAKKDYLSGMKYKDIAEKYEVSINTVKSWKQRNNWQRGPTQKGVHTKSKKGAPKIVESLSANDGLNDQQKMFCLYYLQRFNATWAYMQAYDVDYRTANVNGPRLLGNASVREQIDRLRSGIVDDLMLEADDIAKQYAKQAFADIGDYINFGAWPETLKEKVEGTKTVKGKDGKEHTVRVTTLRDVTDDNGKPVVFNHSYAYFADKDGVDTSLVKSVRMGKDGAVVELYDKQKAMESLIKYFDNHNGATAEEKLDDLLDKVQDLAKGDAESGSD